MSEDDQKVGCVLVIVFAIGAIVGGLIFAAANYNSKDATPVEEKSERINFVRLFYHEHKRYSVFKMDETTKALTLVEIDRNGFWDIKIVCDVPEFESMWYETVKNKGDSWSTAVIHIHGPEDINGSDWNHGKHGRGQTTVVE